MKTLLNRLWNEPAAAAGALVSGALLALALASGEPLTATSLGAIAAPFATGLGVRPFVKPDRD